jgi:hypothetical protein
VDWDGENVWCEGKGILYSIPCKQIWIWRNKNPNLVQLYG